MSRASEWVERNTGRTLTEDQARCIDVLTSISAVHNLSLIGDGWVGCSEVDHDRGWDDDAPERPPVVIREGYVVVRLHGELATYDFDALTRLVLAAHEKAVRVSISAERVMLVDTDSYLSEMVKGEWVETDRHPTYEHACLRVTLHPRQREGSTYDRHPSIEEVLAASKES